MAKNPPPGDGHRVGAVRHRSQTYNPHNERWTKRDADTGRFIVKKRITVVSRACDGSVEMSNGPAQKWTLIFGQLGSGFKVEPAVHRYAARSRGRNPAWTSLGVRPSSWECGSGEIVQLSLKSIGVGHVVCIHPRNPGA